MSITEVKKFHRTGETHEKMAKSPSAIQDTGKLDTSAAVAPQIDSLLIQ